MREEPRSHVQAQIVFNIHTNNLIQRLSFMIIIMIPRVHTYTRSQEDELAIGIGSLKGSEM